MLFKGSIDFLSLGYHISPYLPLLHSNYSEDISFITCIMRGYELKLHVILAFQMRYPFGIPH